MGRRGHNGAVCGNFSRTLFWWIPSVHRIPARISTSKLGYTLVPRARRPTSGSPTPTRKKTNVPAYVPNCLHSAPILQLLRFFFFQRRGDEEIHLLTDSAILDFCSSPSSVTWSAPTFTRGGITDGWRGDSTVCPIIWVVCTNIWSYDRVITRRK